ARAEEWLPARLEDLSNEVKVFVQGSTTADRKKKEQEVAEKGRLRFQRRISAVAVLAALFMAITGVFAWVQWGDAASARDKATAAESRASAEKERADGELKKAQGTQSLFLANLAQQRRAEGDVGTAILLTLAALPDPSAAIVRPYVTEAELQLDRALR